MRRQFTGFKRSHGWHVRNGVKEKRLRDEAVETERLLEYWRIVAESRAKRPRKTV
jgi:hypothetical protein